MLKLDENLGERGKKIFKQAGIDVSSVFEQNLTSSPDDKVIQVCQKEKRCLVTLDQDFANPLIFNPKLYSGIAVIRLSPKPDMIELEECISKLAQGLKAEEIVGKLWIVQRNRIRVYQQD